MQIVVDVEAVHIKHIQKNTVFEGFGHIGPAVIGIHRGYVIPGRGIRIQDVKLEIVLAQLEGTCGINILHH